MTRIALIGYGAMGQAIERNAAAAGCEIVCVYDINSPLTPDSPKDFDVAIEFTQPDAVVSNVEALAALRKHAVIGTTGWHGSLQTVRQRADAAGIGLIYGANFSVGVQMFFQLVRAAAVLADRDDTMDVMLHEWHHKRKKDSPSGTAIAAAQIVLEELSRKTQIATDRMETPIEPNMLHVSSTRGGEIVGTQGSRKLRARRVVCCTMDPWTQRRVRFHGCLHGRHGIRAHQRRTLTCSHRSLHRSCSPSLLSPLRTQRRT
jgi:4-hydroxy-tetrahydrodipicolinate reductase